MFGKSKRKHGVALHLAAVVTAAGIALGTIGTAQANHVSGSCAGDLNAVETAINDAEFLIKSPSREQFTKNQLIGKVTTAAGKIAAGEEKDAKGKTGDADAKFNAAIEELQAIMDKVETYLGATKPKITDAGAASISGAVDDAQICVLGLI